MQGSPRDPEARLIYVLALAVTIPAIAISIGRAGRISGGATLCMLIAATATVGLLQDWRARVRLPRARVARSKHRT